MGSLPADKAGIGSAVNDTTRELGGTLGVAIVGSVFASVYSRRIDSASALAALPADLRSTMRQSTAAAYKVIGQLPAVQAGGVRDAVNHAFLGGMQSAPWSAPLSQCRGGRRRGPTARAGTPTGDRDHRTD